MKNEEVVKKIVSTNFPKIYNFCSDIIPFICHFMYNNFRLASFNDGDGEESRDSFVSVGVPTLLMTFLLMIFPFFGLFFP